MNERSTTGSGSARVRARNDARRTDILRAAARVFRRLGLANAGMREIALEAGLSPGNLYHYFEGKDEILLFCQERTLDLLLRSAARARAVDASASERLRQVLRDHVFTMLDEVEGATAHLEVDALPEAMRERVIARRDAYERAVRSIVSRGEASGEFAPCDPALVTRAMLGAVNWSARWYRADGAKSPGSIADALARYLVRGLSAQTGAPPAAVRATGRTSQSAGPAAAADRESAAHSTASHTRARRKSP